MASAATTAAAAAAARCVGAIPTVGGFDICDFVWSHLAGGNFIRGFAEELLVDRRAFIGAIGSGELLPGESNEPTARLRHRPTGHDAARRPLDSRRGCNRLFDRIGASGGPASAASAASSAAATLGLLVRDFGHGKVFVVAGDPATGARGVVIDSGHLGNVVEGVGNLDQVGAGVAPEADHFDADAHFLDRTNGRRKVAVATHDDRDVQVPSGLHHVDDKFDVEVCLDLAVAVLANVLADDLVAVTGKERMEVALILVVGIEAGVGICPDEVSARDCRFEQRHVVDVRAGCLGRVEDVRHVYKDGDIFTHE